MSVLDTCKASLLPDSVVSTLNTDITCLSLILSNVYKLELLTRAEPVVTRVIVS